MSHWPNDITGMVVMYGTGAAHRPHDPPSVDEDTAEAIRRLIPPLPLPQLVELAKASIATEPRTVEEAATILAHAVDQESRAANAHREALAKAEARYKSELGHVEKLAEKHIAAREQVAAARAKVVELAKREP